MKRVENIHINGIVFNIEDDACAGLSAYIDALDKYFRHEQGGSEIMADIESRIAELFAERAGGTGQVVTAEDVANVIEVLGAIEDITGANGSAETAEPPKQEKTVRRLYRDPDRRCIGGVCAGVSAWMGIHPAILRILFVLTFFLFFHSGISILVYVILWISMPIAKTTAQKLEMQGKPVNISNIERNIKNQLSDADLSSLRQFFNESGNMINRFFGVCVRILGILAGIFMISCGLCAIAGITVLPFIENLLFNHLVEWDLLTFNELLKYIITPSSLRILTVCLWLIWIITVFALVFWGMRLVIRFQIRYYAGHAALFVIWLCAIVVAVVFGSREALRFSLHNSLNEPETFLQADTLYLKTTPSPKLSGNPAGMYFDRENKCFYGAPDIHILKSDNDRIRLDVRKQSQGENKLEAYNNAENICFNVDVKNSTVVIPRFFGVAPADTWKFQQVDVFLYLPEGTVVVFDDDALCFLRRRGVRKKDNIRVMTEKQGLQPIVEKNNSEN
ncbi:MAG: PspC domain-containing protein [Bacteroidales bacterium]|jgi:phage shock protein PspC (stress-responsive transcriptional regulator)|nr:PspC domain-containing protein [Bacteroidales bacterium]